MIHPTPYNPDQIAIIDDKQKLQYETIAERAKNKRLKKEFLKKFQELNEKIFDVNMELYDFDFCYEFLLETAKNTADDLSPINYLEINKQKDILSKTIKTISLINLCKLYAHWDEEFEICELCDEISVKFVETMYRVYLITISGGIPNSDFERKLHLVHSINAKIFNKQIID